MAMTLDGGGVMEYLWEQLDKTVDGEHVYYTELDLDTLWYNGFVDTSRFDIATWKAAFEPYKQEADVYILTKDEFLSLEKYRFTGEIHVPFDAMLINEGKYTDEGLDDLVNASIIPSCNLSIDKVDIFFKKLKADFRQSDGLILIKKEAKLRIKALIDGNPSPLRNLELLVDNMMEQKGSELEAEVEKLESQIASIQGTRQASSFTSKPSSKVEAKAREFAKLQAAKKADHQHDSGAAKVELKKIKRSRKGFRG